MAFNYRAAGRGRSHAEFTAKMGTVCEESDETLGWLEFIDNARLMTSNSSLSSQRHTVRLGNQPA